MLYESEVEADAPVVWWRMDDGAAITDHAGGDYPGALLDGTFTQRPTLAPIEADPLGALELGPSNMVVGEDRIWNAPQWSAEIWFKATDFTGNPTLMAIDYDGMESRLRWRLQLTEAGGLFAAFRDAATTAVSVTSTGPALATATTHHVVVTHDETTLCIYANGELHGTTHPLGPLNQVTSRLEVGGLNPAASTALTIGGFNGTVDEFAYYEKVLTPARVAAHYEPPAIPTLPFIHDAVIQVVYSGQTLEGVVSEEGAQEIEVITAPVTEIGLTSVGPQGETGMAGIVTNYHGDFADTPRIEGAINHWIGMATPLHAIPTDFHTRRNL